MIIDLGWAEGFQFASYAVNSVILALGLKRRIVMNDFLAGRWEGVLTSNEAPMGAYQCTLFITSHNGQDNKGQFYYFKKPAGTNPIIL